MRRNPRSAPERTPKAEYKKKFGYGKKRNKVTQGGRKKRDNGQRGSSAEKEPTTQSGKKKKNSKHKRGGVVETPQKASKETRQHGKKRPAAGKSHSQPRENLPEKTPKRKSKKGPVPPRRGYGKPGLRSPRKKNEIAFYTVTRCKLTGGPKNTLVKGRKRSGGHVTSKVPGPRAPTNGSLAEKEREKSKWGPRKKRKNIRLGGGVGKKRDQPGKVGKEGVYTGKAP